MRRRTASALSPPDLYASTASTTLDVSLDSIEMGVMIQSPYTNHETAHLRYIAALSMKAINALLKSICDLNPGEENRGTFRRETMSYPIGPPNTPSDPNFVKCCNSTVARVLTVRHCGSHLSFARVRPIYEVIVGRIDRIVFKGVDDEFEVAQLFKMAPSNSLLDYFEIDSGRV